MKIEDGQSPLLAPRLGNERNAITKSASWLSAFSRVTSSGAYLPEVDGLRFVAIALVVLVHIHMYVANSQAVHYSSAPLIDGHGSSILLRFIEEGQYGVELFFVISGFILALPFASHYFRNAPALSIRTYLLRRLTRLEPPYLVAMLLLGVLTIATNRRGITNSEALRSIAASSVYLHSAIFGTQSVINFVTWSLEVEIQFYLLVPVLTRLFEIRGRWQRRAGIVLIGLAFAYVQRWIHLDSTPRLYLSVLNFAQYFLAGLFLADLYVDCEPTTRPQSLGWDVVSLFGWPLMFWILGHPSLIRWLLPPHLVLLYWAAFRGVWVRRVLIAPVVTTIGGMCYSIYLLHVAVISAIGRLTLHIAATPRYELHLAAQAALLSAAILVASAVFFVTIERPCMKRDWPARMSRFLRSTFS